MVAIDALGGLLPVGSLVLAATITVAAGFVKGAVGFAMPLIMISGLGSFLAVELALAMLIIPTVITNGIQAFRDGLRAVLHVIRKQARYLAILFLGIVASAQLVVVLPQWALFFALGIPITTFAALQLSGWRLVLTERTKARTEVMVATVAGLLGGVSGTWGPPTVAYLTAINTPKAEAVRTQGVIYGTGAVVLLVAHLRSGVLNAETAPLSWLMVPPALLGLGLGMWVQSRLNQEAFRRVTLIVLVVAGLNLIRRGIVLLG